MQQRRFLHLTSDGIGTCRCQLLAFRDGLAAVAAPHADGRLFWPPVGATVTLRSGAHAAEVAASVVERRLRPFPILVLRCDGELRVDGAGDGAEAGGSRLITVASGKGGTGKTMVAVNLAVTLARTRRVVLVDADFGTANAALAFGLGSVPHIGDLLEGQAVLDDVLVPVRDQLWLLPGGSGTADLANLNEWQFGRLVTVLEELDRRADIILIDAGAGVGRNVTNLLAIADEAVLVTNPEPAALLDAYALVKIMAQNERQPALHVIINRTRRPAEGEDAFQRVRQAAEHFLNLSPACAGVLPDDAAVSAAARARRPVVDMAPGSRLARELSAAAARIAGAGDGAPHRPAAAGWLGRLRALFAS